MTTPTEKELQILKCTVCSGLFTCDHKMTNDFDGQFVKVPHCMYCYFDEGKCTDNHGYQCPKCQKIKI